MDNIQINISDFDSRIKDKPLYTSWYNSTCGFNDSFIDEGKIDYDGLDDHQKLCLYVYSWNLSDIYPRKKSILSKFGWTNYRLQKLIKQLSGRVTAEPTFNLDTLQLNGRGYFFNIKNYELD